jgi:Zn-dependent protease
MQKSKHKENTMNRVTKAGYIKTPVGLLKIPSFWLIQLSMFFGSIFLVIQLGEHVFKNIKELELLGILANPYVATFLVLFTWVHEMGHKIVFRSCNIPVLGPFLLVPIGGLMIAGKKPKPKELILSAIYGPFTGLLAFPMYYIGVTTHSMLWIAAALFWGGINFINLFPLMPFDGGIIFGELLSILSSKAKTFLKYLSIAIFIGMGLLKLELLIWQTLLIFIMWLTDHFTGLMYKKFLGNTKQIQYPSMDLKQTIFSLCEYIVLLVLLGLVTYLSYIYFKH